MKSLMEGQRHCERSAAISWIWQRNHSARDCHVTAFLAM